MKKIRSALAGVLALSGTFTIAAVAPAASVSAVSDPGDVVFINEIHYDDDGADADEGVEVAGPAGTDLTGWKLTPYNGSNGTTYSPLTLSGTIPDHDDGYGTLNFLIVGLQNGDPDGIVLSDATDTVIQFLSYEGSLTATNGLANGLTSTDIEVSESSSSTVGHSLQLTGTGQTYGDFTWAGSAAATRGAPNTGQDFLSAALTIDTQPMSQTIAVGATATLTVAVSSGTAPYSYQWYEGMSGVTTSPIAAATADSYTTDPLTPVGDYDFWVRVTDSDAGSLDSDTATVTAEVATAPVLDAATPADVTIDRIVTTTLSVTVTSGTGPLAYQWYEGTAPDASSKVGTDSSTFETPLLNDTTSYWVEVSGPGGETASRTAVVTVVSPCDGPFTLISAIQGTGGASLEVGNTHTVQAVVVGDFQDAAAGTDGDFNGFHVQEEDLDADADPLTSEGIFIYEGSDNVILDVEKGDLVAVTGVVAEFNGLTQIVATDVEICTPAVGAPTPAAPVLPAPDGDYFERFEGMSVDFAQDLYINEYFNFDRFGEIVLGSSRLFQPTAVAAPGPAATLIAEANALATITLDDGRSSQNSDPYRHPNGADFDLTNRFRGGDTLTNVVGVIDYSFGAYKIQPTGGATYTSVNPRDLAPANVGGRLRVLGMNVLNYFNTLDDGPGTCGPSGTLDCRGANTTTERDRQLAKIVATIEAVDPAVAGLIEIENDAADQAFIDIVTALNTNATTGPWSYIATGFVGTDAIRQGLIYQPALVMPTGTLGVLDTQAFVNPNDYPDDKNRPAVTQAFEEVGTGEVFIVSVNHLKSKGSDCGGPPDDDPQQGNCNGTRTAAAAELVRWLAEDDPTGTGDPDVVVLGDLNAYDYEDPIMTLTAGGYVDLDKRFSGDEAYSYVFDGALGYLDYAMASATLNVQVTGTDVWHTNADEPDLLDYNENFKSLAQQAIYEANPFRASDHDPVIIGLALDSVGPTVTVEQGSAQADPVAAGPVVFDVVFSEDVTGFDDGSTDVGLGGTAGATTATITPVDGANYTVEVSGMTTDGTVTMTVSADAAVDGALNGNLASTSTDNEVTIDSVGPTVTVEQGSAQADPARAEPVIFDVVFSEPVTLSGDGSVILLTGSAAPFAASMTGSGANYTIEITGIGGSGDIEVALAAAAAEDAAGNPSVASTSTDNVVIYDATAPTVTIDQAVTQADPALEGPVVFDVVFSEDVTGFAADDVVLGGTLTGATVAVTGGPKDYIATVTIPDGATGAIEVTIDAGAAADGLGNPSAAATSTDNVVTIEADSTVLEGAARFVPLSPVRLFDTRATETAPGPKGIVGPKTSIDVQVAGEMGVPDNAVAVVMNVTVTDTTGPGFVTAYPGGTDRPTASSINIIEAGQTRPNLVTVPLGDDGMVTLYSLGAVNLLADIAGYYIAVDEAVAAGRFVPLTPQRLFDTREEEAAPGPKGELAAGASIDVQVLGVGDVPATGVSAVVINLTGTQSAAPGFITAYPTGEDLPKASNVNLGSAGTTAPNLAIVPIGADGQITIYSSHGTHALGDVTGYITDDSAEVVTAGLFVPLAPERVFDTRESEPAPGPKGFVSAGGQIDVTIAGAGSIPATATGVVLNVTGIASPAGFLTAWETGPARPKASTLNFVVDPLDTRANGAMLPVGTDGMMSFFTLNGSHILVDAAGYFIG